MSDSGRINDCCGQTFGHTRWCVGAVNDPAITTYTGRKFYPLDPRPEDIYIEDIAHGLAYKCRYNGHSRHYYSVAEHSLLMSTLFPDSPILQRAAMLHDAAEAYFADIPSPIKYMPEMKFYREAENRLQAMIYERFGLAPIKLPEIDQADKYMLHVETESPVVGARHPDWNPPKVTRDFQRVRLLALGPQDAEYFFLGHWEMAR